MLSAGTLNRTPVSRGLQARASLLLDAERGPAAVLLELLQERRGRERLWFADELGPSVAALAFDTPKSRPRPRAGRSTAHRAATGALPGPVDVPADAGS